ncbi:MAG: 23S rRNA (guanosine(2251)-2'-O)-methyltransferase RlmB [Acholeplasmataceae bacterium]|jgi:predicted rRNA methylase|nr:23S rRNA (guanosine(2251)-2'-O)-methyltransferase RlmB [Acholeplasmataceae bacterium]MDY0339145.1 23S rRNA (guanosine(2251)-2'-O)-methyltransferase RlmB [Acholeplasmataceae bacterium]
MIIYGKNVVKEAIFSNRPIYKLWIDEKFSDQHFLLFLKDKKQVYEKVSKGKLNQFSEQGLHQGVVADVKPYETYELLDKIDSNKIQRFIILDNLEDPHNLGAIMRTAEAANIDGIIMSKRGQVQLNQTVAKVSAGAIEHVPVILVSNINQAIQTLKDHQILVVGTDGQSELFYDQIPLEQSLAIVLGNEGEGIRPLVKRNCDMLVKIPMFGKINSLNVSVAAALMMYQTLKK